MTIEATSQEEREDLERRGELQSKLQEALRRSAPISELRKIEQQIETLNKKLESHPYRILKTGTTRD